MPYFLFLDDTRVPSDVTWIILPRTSWTMVRNFNDFCRCIRERGLPEYITFDHDLAAEHYPKTIQKGDEIIEYDKMKEKSGYHCAQWLVTYCQENKVKLPRFSVHSLNKVGTKNIIRLLGGFAQIQANESIQH